MKRGNTYITWDKRLTIERALRINQSIKDIARLIGMSERTIYREIERGRCKQVKTVYDNYGFATRKFYFIYSADVAQSKYDFNKTSKGRQLKLGNDYEFVNYIEKRVVVDKLTPRAALGELRRTDKQFKTDISNTTLYRYIRMGLFPHIEMSTNTKEKHYEHARAKRAPSGTSIEMRPKEILTRQEFGRWEMDCICGPTKSAILQLTERRTRRIVAFALADKKAASVVKCLNKLEYKLGKQFKVVFKSITVDNGSEFSDFEGLERSIFNKRSKRTRLYYCHPYSAYERGSNERLNREVRRLIPKGTDLSKYNQAKLQAVVDWVNNYPREIFGFATSGERFREELAALGIAA